MAVEQLVGKNVILAVGTKVIGCANELSLSIETEMQSAVCAASNGWTQSKPKTKSWSVEIGMLYRYATGADVATNITMDDLIKTQLEDGELTISFQTSATGGLSTDGIVGTAKYVGKCYVASSGLSGGADADANGSISLTGNGELVQTLIAAV